MDAKTESTHWKRKFSRVDMDMKGDFRILREEKEKELFSSQIKTVGEGGLMLVSSVPLAVDTPLQVRLFHGNNVITLFSTVVWTKPVDENEASGFKIGLQYHPIHQASLLHIDFLLQTEQNNRQIPSNPDHPQ